MKKIILMMVTIGCMLGACLFSFDCFASGNYVRLFVDCDGGTCHTTNAYDIITGEDRILVGSTVSSVYDFDEDPTAIDKDFVGWYVYDMSTGAQIAGTGLLTTAQVSNYVIPNHDIKFVAQWNPRTGYPVKNITYVAFWDGQGEPCYDVKISITYDGICYSGYGFVSIPESVYSTWSGNVSYKFEPLNGAYIMADGKWSTDIFEYEGTVKSFIKEKSSYLSASATGKGRDNLSPRRKVHDWYYQASFIAPDVSVFNTTTAGQVISDTAVVPATYIVQTEVYQAGTSFDTALNAVETTYGTSNVVVVDINLKDDHGAKVSQLSDYVDVKVDIPATYTIQPGNTVVVYYLNDNGILEECETVYNEDDPNNRYVLFKTNHFSVYVLVETEIEPVIEPEVVPVPEESEEADVVIWDSVESDATNQTQQTQDILEETPTEDKVVEDNSGNHLNFSFAWIVGVAALIVFVVFLFLFVKNKKKK